MSNSKRKCKQCGEFKMAAKGIKTPVAWFCSYNHAIEFAKDKVSKTPKVKIKKISTGKALRDFNRKDLRWQHNLTQKVFNKLRVLEEKKWFSDRGIEPYCISCGKENMDWCCGHFKTVGAQGRLRYDSNNTFLQCNRYCNMGLSGNIEGNKNTHGYKAGLVLRFGEKEGGRILDYCESNNAPMRWDWEALEELRRDFNIQIRKF